MRFGLFFFLPMLLGVIASGASSDYTVFVGGYGKTIQALRFQAATGRFTRIGTAVDTPNPSFLITNPSGRLLFAVNENGANDDTVSSFSVDAQAGKLKHLSTVSSHGSAPCDLALDHTGKWLAVANYSSGTIAVLPVHADGSLGEAVTVEQHKGTSVNAERQKGPHAHSVNFSPDNRFLLSADLGADKIFVYHFDAATGKIKANDPASSSVKPGAGVRHLLFHPSGKAVYAINEMGSSVSVFRYDAASGTLNDAQTVTMLPADFKGATTAAELAMNTAGTVLYASNRGHDSVAIFSIDPARYLLSPLEITPTLGKTPRYVALDPTGAFLIAANQDSDTLTVFSAHPKTGQLRPSGPVLKEFTKPSCFVFVQ